MARVARLAGALLVETDGRYFLVGNLKVPCDFAREGFEPPVEPIQPAAPRDPGTVDARGRPYVPLRPLRPIELARPCLLLELEGEALARLLAERLLIERNASVSERLWNLCTAEPAGESEVPARWLAEVPATVWRAVRETVLKCS